MRCAYALLGLVPCARDPSPPAEQLFACVFVGAALRTHQSIDPPIDPLAHPLLPLDGTDRIVSKGSYEEPQAVELLQKLLEAVVYMHHQGVVHRDIKPENILMRDHESDTDFKIADFGFAAFVPVR